VFQRTIVTSTGGRGFYELTADVTSLVASAGIDVGLCNLYCRHTSASLIICENADPGVLRDLETFLVDLVPDGDPRFTHDAEGPDDMPAHVRSVLTQSALTIPIIAGRPGLGTWQGIFLYEHRISPHRREVVVTATA